VFPVGSSVESCRACDLARFQTNISRPRPGAAVQGGARPPCSAAPGTTAPLYSDALVFKTSRPIRTHVNSRVRHNWCTRARKGKLRYGRLTEAIETWVCLVTTNIADRKTNTHTRSFFYTPLLNSAALTPIRRYIIATPPPPVLRACLRRGLQQTPNKFHVLNVWAINASDNRCSVCKSSYVMTK